MEKIKEAEIESFEEELRDEEEMKVILDPSGYVIYILFVDFVE